MATNPQIIHIFLSGYYLLYIYICIQRMYRFNLVGGRTCLISQSETNDHDPPILPYRLNQRYHLMHWSVSCYIRCWMLCLYIYTYMCLCVCVCINISVSCHQATSLSKRVGRGIMHSQITISPVSWILMYIKVCSRKWYLNWLQTRQIWLHLNTGKTAYYWYRLVYG